jgi:hypothetical protein
MVKYFCDDCGSELTEYDSIAHQLDMTGHVYCHGCIDKRADFDKPKYWTSENKPKPKTFFGMKVYHTLPIQEGEIFESRGVRIVDEDFKPPKYTLIDTDKRNENKTK